MNMRTVGFGLALCLLSGAAMAQGVSTQKTDDPAISEARQKTRAACAADVQKLCANAGTERGAVGACLDSNAAQLSPDCSSARAARAAAKAAAKPKT